MSPRVQETVSRWAALLTLALFFGAFSTTEIEAQDPNVFSVGAQFQGYSFDDGLGPSAAQLLIAPIAYRLPLGDRFSADLYTAWASGSVEQDDLTFDLKGFVDTRIRARYRASEWALVSFSLNLPTGDPTHDSEEALVASVLSSDLLGFRESNFGYGFGATTGIATAFQVGEWALGTGFSYRLAGEFEPSADTSFSYQPGDELRLRVGLDRNVGQGGKLTLGLTWQNYAEDQVDGRNLFQAGNRVRGDLRYSFRAGSGTWTAFATDVWRDQGDLTLDIINENGGVVGDTTIVVGNQNLLVLGLSGSVPIGTTLRVRPQADLRLQSREDGRGSGWLLGVGGDVPLRLFGSYELFPLGRFLIGSIEGEDGESYGTVGAEVGLTLRWRG